MPHIILIVCLSVDSVMGGILADFPRTMSCLPWLVWQIQLLKFVWGYSEIYGVELFSFVDKSCILNSIICNLNDHSSIIIEEACYLVRWNGYLLMLCSQAWNAFPTELCLTLIHSSLDGQVNIIHNASNH